MTHTVATHRRYFYVMATWWKRTKNVFRISELLPSYNKIYHQLFKGGDKFSGCFCQEKRESTSHRFIYH